MFCNVGGLDRMLRMVVGFGLIFGGIYYESLWGFVGIIPIFTAIFRICPIYIPFKFSTCKSDKDL